MTNLVFLALALPAVLADWTVTLSPTSDKSRCVTSDGVGNPVKILPCDGSEAQKWITFESCGSRFWQAATGRDMILQAGYGESSFQPFLPSSRLLLLCMAMFSPFSSAQPLGLTH